METPETSKTAFKEVINDNENVIIRQRVAAAIADQPATTDEITKKFPNRGKNTIRPRINELIRMGCVSREGKKTNESGKEAYVNHITQTGIEYVHGNADPDLEPPIAELADDVVSFTREYINGNVDEKALKSVLERHDEAKMRRKPEWNPEGEIDESDYKDQGSFVWE